ncbi:hypothetical protein [Marinomonas shanghaiensis]|jgi:hypothetical protein|uniref:hypothetical protein n=1 Tax=Marinomonas shanghaiensis TaxID=2202418 RepID=UPI000DB9B7E4|nr:hypothetical protein [Marinomonas shanghaiensis]
MKSKSFVPAPKRYQDDKKPKDYWGMLFISFIFLSSMSCFLFANHGDRQTSNRLSDSIQDISTKMIDTDQRSKS